jgi:glycosyltransferase involved in cell wall biosynthesis
MKYSIILPVRNGSNHIKECVTGILTQSIKDFELLVLENCSTDNTIEIISSFKDHRIKLFSVSNPLTIEQNWQRAVNLQKKEFITLIGHDDILDKDYLLAMEELIRKHPKASLYQTHFRYINSKGKEIGKCQPMAEVQLPAEAIHNFLCNKIDLMGTGFMMRSRDYDSIGGIPAYPNLLFADMELWIELSRRSYLAVDKRECFAYRKHAAATTSASTDAKFLESFELLVNYLSGLRIKNPDLAEVISADSAYILRQYCQGITHKVLRTPKGKRQTAGVTGIIDKFREFGYKLGNENFEPLHFKSIRMGKMIDDSSLLHALFLLFKRLYKKPVLKN